MTEPFEVRIEKLVYGGEGLGRHEGHTVFAPFVLPGETVTVKPLERRKKFVRGRVTSVTIPSPDRVAAECPHFGTCGGCNYQHIPYEAQLRYKAEILRETLARLGKIVWEGAITTHGSPPYGYRNRAQWKIAPGGDGQPAVGYFEAGSRRLCPARVCPILSPRLREALAVFSRLTASRALPLGLLEVEVFADDADEKLLLNLSFEEMDGPVEAVSDLLRAELPGAESFLVHIRRADRFELVGPGYLTYGVAAHRYRVGHLSFFQVNRFLLPELAAMAIGDARGRLAVDLFAGVGLFTLPLAHRFERVVGVESNAATARDLEHNLQTSGAASSSAARHSDVAAFLGRWRETPDFVLLDPPRAGVPAASLERLAKLGPAAIAYLSCDPATLARDLTTLVGTKEKPGKYEIGAVHLVDMFPQSYHLEALLRLTRRA
jgi:23S rRNA (uracil1939-C5)-methyltransferase